MNFQAILGLVECPKRNLPVWGGGGFFHHQSPWFKLHNKRSCSPANYRWTMPLETTINYQCFIINYSNKKWKSSQKKSNILITPHCLFCWYKTSTKHIFPRQDAPVHNKAVAHATKRVRLHWLKAGCDRLRMSTLEDEHPLRSSS